MTGREERTAGAAVFALAVVAYLPALWCGWIWDDNAYVTGNAVIQSWGGIADVWLRPSATPQYYPLVHTTYWVEHKVWGLWPAGYHAVNVLLHALNAWLLMRAMRRLGLPLLAAALGGALFAVHPVQVESVAWVTERKNVLSMAFYLGSGLLWLRWAGLSADRGDGEGDPRLWAGALALFVGALLSKSVTATLPALLLVLAWWRRGGITRRDVLSLLPWLALGVASGLFTAYLETAHVGAEGEDWALTPGERVLLAGRAVWFYAWKLLFPVDLVFIYPRWTLDASAAGPWLFPFAAVCLPAALLLLRDRIGRGPAAALLCYGGTLFPALGFFNVYPFRYSFVADHFQYHASAALLALAAAGLARASSALHRLRAGAGRAVPALVLLPLGVLVWPQIAPYQDFETLFREVLARNPGAWIAWNNLGVMAMARKSPEASEMMIRRSVELNPRNYEAWNNLGYSLETAGRLDEAVDAYEHSIAIMPEFALAQGNLGRTLVKKGEMERAVLVLKKARSMPVRWPWVHEKLVEALFGAGRIDEAVATCLEAEARFPAQAQFTARLGELLLAKGDTPAAVAALERAAKRTPGISATHNNLAVALRAAGRREDAEREWREALRLRPDNLAARLSLARLLVEAGRAKEAEAEYREAFTRDPACYDALYPCAVVLANEGRTREAADLYRRALQVRPTEIKALNDLAWILATAKDDGLRSPAEALELAGKAVATWGRKDALVLETLAAACAAAGRFEEAMKVTEEALALDPAPELAGSLRKRLEIFRRHEAIRE